MLSNYTVANLFYIKKDKAAFRSITGWLANNIEPPEVTFVKSVSSVITHILIEMENSESSNEVIAKAEGYKLSRWADIQLKLINGEMSVDEAFTSIKTLVEDI